MFKKLLNKVELEELNSKIITLNNLMLNCASGDSKSCEKVKAQYKSIVDYKDNKIKEIFGDSNMNENYHTFKSEPLTTGRFIQSPRRMTGFEAVNRFSDCNYAIPSSAANQIPIMVGAVASNSVDSKISEIEDLFAEFDQKMGTGVQGVVGKSFFKKLKKKLSFNMSDVKREVTQALNPVHMAEQFKKVTKANLDEAAAWGKRILKNPGELLHPPLPRTGNKFIDEEILAKIEDLAKKVDPAWQIGDFVRQVAVQPVIEAMKGKKDKKDKKDEQTPDKQSVDAAYSTWRNKMISYLDQAFLNNPVASEEIKNRAYSALEEESSRIRRDCENNVNNILKETGAGSSISIALERLFKDRFVRLFEKAVKDMFRAANIPFSDITNSVVDSTVVNQHATGGEDQKRFLDLFNKIKDQKNRGLFRGSCGPDSKEIESVMIGNEVYKVCEPQRKFRTIIKYKDVKLHQKPRRTRGVVEGYTTEYKTEIKIRNLAANAEKLKMIKAATPGIFDSNAYKGVFSKLNPNQGLFSDQCGIHSEPTGNQNIDNQNYQICNVVPATEEPQYITKKRYVKGVGACPTCIVEDINMLGNSPAIDFFRLSGIKYYSGNNMEGKIITRV